MDWHSVDGRVGSSKIFPWHPDTICKDNPAKLRNFAFGEWVETKQMSPVINPLNGDQIIFRPNTSRDELFGFIKSLESCSLYGLHNPFYRPERYRLYGDICRRATEFLRSKKGNSFFTKLINLVMPKGYDQCKGEVDVVASFLETFSGNGVRNLAMGEIVPGDSVGISHFSHNYRWPYGPVAIITPFNFPLEIMALQLMGALFMGNKPVLKQASTTSIVAEAFIRLLLACGMPRDDMLLIHCDGEVMEKLVSSRNKDGELIVQLTQFTGGSDTARRLMGVTEGRVKMEDAGFDWKILGPNVVPDLLDAVAIQSDKDAYAASGQKCSAQSILFLHKNWVRANFLEKIAVLAAKRNLSDLSIGPVLSWTNERLGSHVRSLMEMPCTKLLFGGEALLGYNIPACYGAYKPTAVEVWLQNLVIDGYFNLVTTEVFGPVQIIVQWETKEDLDFVLDKCNRMKNHLTAAVVDSDTNFINYVIARTTNGTTYAGMLAPTTGAPEWHHFGPCGHPSGANIGTPNAIRQVWSQERTITFKTTGNVM